MKSEFNVVKVRRDFPILSLKVNAKPLIYFDNAATTQKPRVVIEALNQFYKLANANVHRGAHSLSNKATSAFEQARECVAKFINATDSKEVIWCKGTTEAINLVANSLGSKILEAGDCVLVSTSEHHANIVPWQLVAAAKGASVIAIPLDTELRIDLQAYEQLLHRHKPKIVALGHVSNALGTIHPIAKMLVLAKKIGAVTLVDGAQAVAHLPIDVQQLGCDFYCFSGHKCFGPTGIGVLWGKQALLEAMPPWQGGGEMIEKVSFDGTSFNQLPFKFEAGTPPIAAAIALGYALSYLSSSDRVQSQEYEQALADRLAKGVQKIADVNLYYRAAENVGIVSFTVQGIHHQDIAMLLDQSGIAVRSGHHCAMPLMQSLGLEGTLRASISFYNTEQEVDFFIQALQQAIELLKDQPQAELTAESASLAKCMQQSIQYPASEIIISELATAKSWQQRFSYLMTLADMLVEPNAELLDDEYKLQQCESGVWLKRSGPQGYQAWSDARLMRGLLVMLISCREQALADCDKFLQQVKLSQYLSPSRTNGVTAILKQLAQTQ